MSPPERRFVIPVIHLLRLRPRDGFHYDVRPYRDTWRERHIILRIICAIFGHKYVATRFTDVTVVDMFPPHFITCLRCKDIACRITRSQRGRHDNN